MENTNSWSSIIDSEALDELDLLQNPGEPDIKVQIYNLFVSNLPARVARMREALQAQNLHLLRIEAHALKSMCSTIGARQLAALCLRIEHCENTESAAELRAKLDEVDLGYERAKTELSRLILKMP